MEIDPETLKLAFKAAAHVYKHGLPVPLPDTLQDSFNLVVKPIASTTKPMIKLILRW